MSVRRRPKFGLGWILSPTQWGNGFRDMLLEAQNVLGWAIFDGAPTGTVLAHVVGMQCLGGSTANRSQVRPGFAVQYDSTKYGTPESDFGFYYNLTSTEISHVVADTLNRIDVISMVTATVDDAAETVAQYNSAPQSNVNTQTGSRVTFVVTKGTPNASPVAPAVPTGNVPLYQVLIPANDNTPGNWTYTDNRAVASGSMRRDGNMPIQVTGVPVASAHRLARFYDNDANALGTNFEGSINFDMQDRLLNIWRAVNPADANEAFGTFVPMVLPSNRQEVVMYGAQASYVDTTNVGLHTLGYGINEISLTEGGVQSGTLDIHIPVRIRYGMKLVKIEAMIRGVADMHVNSQATFTVYYKNQETSIIAFSSVILNTLNADSSHIYVLPNNSPNDIFKVANAMSTLSVNIVMFIDAADDTLKAYILEGVRVTWEHYRSGPTI